MRRTKVLPVLIAAIAAVAILYGCNGNGLGNGEGKSNVGATATSFYVSGKAGVASTSSAQIGFASGDISPDPYALVVADPASTGDNVNTVAQGGTWLPMASISEFTGQGNGLMGDWAPRFLIYAQMSGTSPDAPLYLLDLGKTSGSSLPSIGVRFSTASTVTSNLCTYGASAGLVLQDGPAPQNSWATLRVVGADGSCTSPHNQTIAIPLTAGVNTAPKALGLAEPVEAIHGSDGSLTGAIELVHVASTSSGSPTLQRTDANLNVVGAIGTSQAMQGTGNTTSGSGLADFQSLGVTTNGIWLYRDGANVNAINLASPATVTTLLTVSSTPPVGDTLPAGHALFDPNGTVAYLAISNTTGTSHLVRIDASASPVKATTVVQESTATSIQLAGLTATTDYLVYYVTAGGGQPSVVKAVPKTGSNVTAPLTVQTLTSTQSVDAVPPAIVGDTVYYTLDDSNTANPARQLYYASFSTGGASSPQTFAASGTGCAVLIRPFYATPLSTSSPPVYGSVLIAESSGFCSGSALAYADAQLFTRDSGGNTGQAGRLPQLEGQLSNPPAGAATALNHVDFSYFFGSIGTTTPLDGPVQSGMPTFLELDGATSTPTPAIDIEVFTPGAGQGPTRLTQNLL